MRFSPLTVLPLITAILATPIPEAEPEAVPGPQDAGAFAIAGVNITNGELAGTAAVVKNSYIIVYKDDVTDATIDKYEASVSKKLGKGLKKTYRVKSATAAGKGFAASQVETDRKGLEAIAKDPAVAYVELDGFASIAPIDVNSTTSASQQDDAGVSSLVQRPSATWGLGRISHKLRGFYNYIYDNSGCAGTRIYVLDTGIRTTHEQFRGNTVTQRRAVHGANFISGQPFTDEHGHGTHCAGTAAGWTTGVCRQATIVNVKVLGRDGRGSLSGIIAGMNWAANDAIRRGYRYKAVLSVSLGAGYSSSVNAAVQGVVNAGIPVVVAAGNDNANAYNTSPASAPNAITVGATDFYDRRASFSNWGGALDVFGPGVSVLSSYYTSDTSYYFMSGTSQATPHVAGLAAYFIAKDKIAGAYTVRNKIVAVSGKNYVTDTKGSANRIAYNNNGY